jgi:hypothetical protein
MSKKNEKTEIKYEVKGYLAEDAKVIGEELCKMAKGGDIQALDKREVFETIRDNPRHPLRRFFNWDESEAAYQHWISQTANLIRSVRVFYVPVRSFEKQLPPTVTKLGPEYRRAKLENGNQGYVNVQNAAAAKNPRVFDSMIALQVNSVRNAVRTLTQTAEHKPGEGPLSTLIRELQVAISKYEDATTTIDAAAEE